MLRKYLLSMMVLLVAASLIGINSIHQYVGGQAPKPQQKQAQEHSTVQVAGRVVAAIISASKTCIAFVDLPGDKPNLLRLKPGTTITLFAPIESCALFGLSKIGNTQIQFVTQIAPSSTERQYRVTQVIL
jgi:hypothetical protein